MVARGVRTVGDYEGYLFYVGPENEQSLVQESLKKNEGPDFKDGALNLRVLQKLPDILKNRVNFNNILDKFDGEWMIPFAEMKEGQSGPVQNAMDSARDLVLAETK